MDSVSCSNTAGERKKGALTRGVRASGRKRGGAWLAVKEERGEVGRAAGLLGRLMGGVGGGGGKQAEGLGFGWSSRGVSFFFLFQNIFPKPFLNKILNANKFKTRQSAQNKTCSSMNAYSCF